MIRALIIVLSLTILSSCSKTEPPVHKEPVKDEAHLLIGLIPEQNIFKQLERYEPLAGYLSEKIGMVGFELEKDNIKRGDAEISIRIKHPFRPGDVVSFNDGINPRTGIVKWSDETTDNNFRAGIEFI